MNKVTECCIWTVLGAYGVTILVCLWMLLGLCQPAHADGRLENMETLDAQEYCTVVTDQFLAGVINQAYGSARAFKDAGPEMVERVEHGMPIPKDAMYVQEWNDHNEAEKDFVRRHVLEGYDEAAKIGRLVTDEEANDMARAYYQKCTRDPRTAIESPFRDVAARSYRAKADFARAHPCPSTGKRIPHCPGYVIDHVIPLCAGGADKPANMQWQTRAASYKKDVIERAQCARHDRLVRVEALENVAPEKRKSQCTEWLHDHQFIGKAVAHGRDCDQMKQWTADTPDVPDERRAKIARILIEACAAENVQAWFDKYWQACLEGHL